jgi:hypothetical protein
MAWHIKKTSLLGDTAVGTVYYRGDNSWTQDYDRRNTYTSQAKAKEEDFIWKKKTTAGWDVTAVNESA